MTEWRKPEIQDAEAIKNIVSNENSKASDISFGNIFLLRAKYNTEICFKDGFLLRYYHGKESRNGYAFPIGEGDISKVLSEIKKDSEQYNRPFNFILLTEEQKQILKLHYPEIFEYECDEGNSDYIYSRDSLALLAGKTYHKKKNRFLKFIKTYKDCAYKPLTSENTSDACFVAEQWLKENGDKNKKETLFELYSIKEALNNIDLLGISGGIVYTENKPVAMTMASYISKNTIDVHFEKAVGEYAENGAYSAINKLFAEKTDAVWINREEDMNIPGLRKAKTSYHPEILLKKYTAKEKE